MSWIATISESEATGEVKQVYDGPSNNRNRRRVGAIISVFSLRADLLKARVGFSQAMTFGGSGLGRRREELIATSISGLLGCKY